MAGSRKPDPDEDEADAEAEAFPDPYPGTAGTAGTDEDEPDETPDGARSDPVRARPGRLRLGRKPQAEKAKRPPRTRVRSAAKTLAVVEGELAGGIAAAAIPISIALPVTGLVTMQQAPSIAAAVVALAETNPAVKKALLAAGGSFPYLDLGRAGGAIVLAAMVDRGVMRPDAMPAQALGVTDAYMAIYPQTDGGQDTAPVVPLFAPPPSVDTMI